MKNRKGFYAALRKVADKFDWNAEHGIVRGIPKFPVPNEVVTEYCPMNAVALSRGIVRYNYPIVDLGESLGIGSDDARLIAEAADQNDSNGSKKRARTAILKAVGLS